MGENKSSREKRVLIGPPPLSIFISGWLPSVRCTQITRTITSNVVGRAAARLSTATEKRSRLSAGWMFRWKNKEERSAGFFFSAKGVLQSSSASDGAL
jgi:hypothetical protein